MASTPTEDDRLAWALAKDGLWQNCIGAIYSLFRMSDVAINLKGITFTVVRTMIPIVIAATPFLLKQLTGIPLLPQGATLPQWVPGWAASFGLEWLLVIGTLALMLLAKVLDFLKKSIKDKNKYSKLEHRLTMRNSALSGLFSQYLIRITPHDSKEIQDQALLCIHDQARLILGHDSDYLEVSLLVFREGVDDVFIQVENRAIGHRKAKVPKPAQEVMAYYVALTGKEKNINNILSNHPFSKKGISQEKVEYKSILLMPILTPSGDSCLGVVSIDSERPYEFSGGLSQRLVLRSSTYLNILRSTLKSTHLITVKGE